MNAHYRYHIACRIIAEWVAKNNPNELLNLSHLDLETIPSLPMNVRKLDISYNKLKSMPVLPSSIHTVLCNHNYIEKIECIPLHILHINISNNLLGYKPYRLSPLSIVEYRGNPFFFDCIDNNHEECIMDLRYSEGIVQTLLDGI
jgi:hypothetical protein